MIKTNSETDSVNHRVDWYNRRAHVEMRKSVRYLIEDDLGDRVWAWESILFYCH